MTNLSRRQFVGGSALAASALTLAACGGNASADAGKANAEKSTIIVFAAASMTESLTKAPPAPSRPRSRRAPTATSSSPPARSR